MPAVQDSDIVNLSSQEVYKVWKGQLHIQERMLCDIALQSSSTVSIPAELPFKLGMKEVIRLSELRKALPRLVFEKTSFTGQEVHCENVYYSLYSILTSNEVGDELHKLLKWLLDQDVALIRVLNDQGFLILVTSSVLQCDKDPKKIDPSHLNALFLFPHTKLLQERERKQHEYKFKREGISLNISNLLPGLQYAISETSRKRKDKEFFPNSMVELYFKKYVIRRNITGTYSERQGNQNDAPCLFPSSEKDVDEKCSEIAYSRLQSYVSSPLNFSLPLLKLSTLLTEGAATSNRVKHSKNGAKLEHMLEVKVGGSRKRSMRKGRKKRARKRKQKCTHRVALPSTEISESQATSKKRLLLSGFQKEVGSSTSTTLKLASAPDPQQRKRGAEVLTAEFVQGGKVKIMERRDSNQRTKGQETLTSKNNVSPTKTRKTSSPEDLILLEKPVKRKAIDTDNTEMSPDVKTKAKALKLHERDTCRLGKQSKQNVKDVKDVDLSNIDSFRNPIVEALGVEKLSPLTAITQDRTIDKRISMYASHALNLLADLALNSYNPTNLSYIPPKDETVVDEQVQCGSADTPEHPEKSTLPVEHSNVSWEPSKLVEHEKEQPKDGSKASKGNVTSPRSGENNEKPTSLKAQAAAAKAKARNNATSKICLEHSYSQLPIENLTLKSSKEQSNRSVTEITTPSPTEVVVEQPSNLFIPGEIIFVASDNLCPIISKDLRAVPKLQDNFLITFHWEANYDFDLDSKFTSDPLEKTINRALHGPWNPHLKEKVEDVKIILHMWLALFYSKPNKQQSNSSRKVVEHSNPAKYVSINTVLDPFEFYEIMDSGPDNVPTADTENTKGVNKSQIPCPTKLSGSPLLHRTAKNLNKNSPDVVSMVSSIPKKDFNIKLSSEIFQTCNTSNATALYTNSLQRTVKCNMAPTSNGAPTPTHYMKTVFGASVPGVCYVGDTEQFNTELNDKTKKCMDIGDGSSGKVKVKEKERECSEISSVSGTGPASHSVPDLLEKRDASKPCVNKEKAKMDEKAHTSGAERTLHGVRIKDMHEDKGQMGVTQEYFCVKRTDTEVSPSCALNVDVTKEKSTLYLSSQNGGHITPLLKTIQLSKSNSDLEFEIQPVQKRSEHQPKNVLLAAENDCFMHTELSNLLHEKEDSAVLHERAVHLSLQNAEHKELGRADDQLLIEKHTSKEVMMDESSSDHVADLNSSFDVEIQALSHNDTSLLKRLENGIAALALETNKNLPNIVDASIGNLSAGERPSSPVRHSPSMGTSKPSRPDGIEGHVTRDIESQTTTNIKDEDVCITPVLSARKDCNFVIDLCNKIADKASSACEVNPAESVDNASEISPVMLGDRVESEEDSALHENEMENIATTVSFNQVERNIASDKFSGVEIVDTKTVPDEGDMKSTIDHLESVECESPCKVGSKPPENTVKETQSSIEPVIAVASVDNAECPLQSDSVIILEKDHYIHEIDHGRINIPESDDFSDVSMLDDSNMDDLTISHSNFSSSNLSIVNSDPLIVNPETDPKQLINNAVMRLSPVHSDNVAENISEICEGEVSPDKTLTLRQENKEDMPLLTTEKTDKDDVLGSTEDSSLIGKELCAFAKLGSNYVPVGSYDLQSHVHSEELADRNCLPLAAQPPVEKENSTNNFSSVGIINDKSDLPDSSLVETELHALSKNKETLNITKSVPGCEILNMPNEMPPTKIIPILTEKSNIIQSSCNMLDSNIASMSNDLLIDGSNETVTKQLPVKEQEESHLNTDVNSSHISRQDSNVKSVANCSRNTSHSKREILSKLKRICMASVTTHPTCSSSEENVLFVLSKTGKGSTEVPNDLNVPNGKDEGLPVHDENDSLLKDKDIIMETKHCDNEIFVKDSILPGTPVSYMSPATADPESLDHFCEITAQNNCLSSFDEFAESMEQDPLQEESDICCIINTGSISKEQYDRWSDTSDDDIAFIREYKESLLDQENTGFVSESHPFPSSSPDKPPFSSEPTPTRMTECSKRPTVPSTMLQETEENLSYQRGIGHPRFRSHDNVVVTKNVKETDRTFLTVHRESSECFNLENLLSHRRMVSDNLTQSTIDMENLRFICKLKAVLRNSSIDKQVCDPPFQTMFESRRIPGCSRSTVKCRSPLLVTVHCQNRKREFKEHDRSHPSTSYGPVFYEDKQRERPVFFSKASKKIRTCINSPFHFSRLRYENTLEKSNSDISLILKECVQSNHLKLSNIGLGNAAIDQTSNSQLAEESDYQTKDTFVFSSPKSQTVKRIISDLCTSLHSRLHSVATESEQKNFYIFDTSDDPFFSLTKCLLIKEGYSPADPQDFCNSKLVESNKLFVIIRNEDVASHINKIPCLLRLKLLPTVLFAGVDTPEDITEATYQELYQAGGFVLSDKTVLENISLAKLKEVLTIVEKMNRTSEWKWLIHYRDNRKLMGDKRAESVSQLKMSLLKSYQHSNIMEILPYHQCDSKSKETSDDLACLLNLLSQHIRSRLAVYLTGSPCTMADEFEQKGILVFDVDTFIRRIQSLDAQLQMPC